MTDHPDRQEGDQWVRENARLARILERSPEKQNSDFTIP
jgi:hypothetical protein